MHPIIENLNFASDPRNGDPDSAPILILSDGTQVPLPTRWEVCDVCNGDGTHVNPSIDCHGLTPDDFAEDPDFAEEYLSGTYDVPCNKCQGRTTMRAVDLDRLSPQHLALWEQQQRDEAYDRAEHWAEIRMGA